MNINIKATNIESTEALNDYVVSRLDKLEKFGKGQEVTGHVEIGKTTNHHKQGEDVFKAEFDMRVGGERFFAIAEAPDLYAAIDEAKEEIVRRVSHAKDRKQTLFRRGATSVKKMVKGISKRNPFTSKY